MNTPCQFVQDICFLSEDLVDKQYLSYQVKNRTKVKWKCITCKCIWSESIALRKRYNECPTCESRKPASKCLADNCNTFPIYNFPEYRWGSYCKKHSLPDMIDIKSSRCAYDGCMVIPTYNLPGSKTGLYCKMHKSSEMIDVKSKRCQFNGCNKQASYNFKGLGKLYCKDHKLDGMDDVAHKKCHYENCNKIPCYNVAGTRSPLYCNEHKLKSMVDVAHKRCASDGCVKIPCFNFPGNSGGLYCKAHRSDGMIDVITKKCCIDGCDIFAKWNVPGNTKRLYCSEHKLPDMIDVAKKLCKNNECKKTASFNYPENEPKYCSEHKLPDMIGVTRNYCIVPGCNTVCIYNVPGHKPEYCVQHKKPGMISHPTKRCENCKELATHGETKAIRCEKHALKEDVNLLEKICRSCNLSFVLNVENLCEFCDPSNKYRKAKELEVKEFFDANNLIYTTHDKTIDQAACGNKERPDFLFDCGTHFVVVEVDEDQHIARNCDCEIIRMFNISQSLKSPTIFIRYNPDNYRAKGEKKRSSGKSRRLRMVKLKEWVKYCQEKIPDTYLSVIHLFFDEWDEIGQIVNIPI